MRNHIDELLRYAWDCAPQGWLDLGNLGVSEKSVPEECIGTVSGVQFFSAISGSTNVLNTSSSDWFGCLQNYSVNIMLTVVRPCEYPFVPAAKNALSRFTVQDRRLHVLRTERHC